MSNQIIQSRVSLAKIKHAEFASEETHCFSAEVLLDGKVVALVSNDGHGGCDMWYPARKGGTMTEAYAAKKLIDDYGATFPPHVCSFEESPGVPATLPVDADLIIGDLIEEWHRAKDQKRRIKRAQKLLATKSTYLRDGSCFTFKTIVPPEKQAQILAKYPGAEFVNDLPFEVAFAKLEAAHAI